MQTTKQVAGMCVIKTIQTPTELAAGRVQQINAINVIVSIRLNPFSCTYRRLGLSRPIASPALPQILETPHFAPHSVVKS
jgi:hypothetical protein